MNKKKKDQNNKKNSFKKSLLISAISGIALVVFFIIGQLVPTLPKSTFLTIINLILNILIYASMILFAYGFFVLGKKYDNRLLKVISLILMILYLISFAVIQIMNISLQDFDEQLTEKLASIGIDISSDMEITQEQAGLFMTEILPMLLPLIISLAGYMIILLILSILFGVGLIKLRKNVKYAKTAGILEIIGSGSLLLLVGFIFLAGFLVLSVAYIFQIIILFKEAKKD